MPKKLIIAVLFSFIFSSQLFAVNDAGCGLGSLVFSKNSIVSQTLAGTTNGTFSNQFFGITTGTSGCKANGLVKVDREQIYYVETNFENLQIEMAKGKGERLVGLALLMGCSDQAVSEFSQMTREKYEVIFPVQKTTAVEMLNNLKSSLKANQKLAKSCQVVG